MLQYTPYLAANITGHALFKRRMHDPAFDKIAKKIFNRDQDTCQCCGFSAQEYQCVLNLDGNYRNNATENLITACLLCAQCQFLGAQDSGKVIVLPEYTQAQLNNVVRVLFCLIENDTPYNEQAKAMYRAFRHRTQNVEQLLGDGMSDAAVFGQSLIDANVDTRSNEQAFGYFRLLPSRVGLELPIAYWSTLILPQLNVSEFLPQG